MSKLNLRMTDTEYELIQFCANRAVIELGADHQSTMMDLACVNNQVKLDFDELLEFNKFNFAHDIHGIANHLNRKTGKLGDLFLPRCAKKVTA